MPTPPWEYRHRGCRLSLRWMGCASLPISSKPFSAAQNRSSLAGLVPWNTRMSLDRNGVDMLICVLHKYGRHGEAIRARPTAEDEPAFSIGGISASCVPCGQTGPLRLERNAIWRRDAQPCRGRALAARRGPCRRGRSWRWNATPETFQEAALRNRTHRQRSLRLGFEAEIEALWKRFPERNRNEVIRQVARRIARAVRPAAATSRSQESSGEDFSG